jgi:CRP-like cAMP-binding protein
MPISLRETRVLRERFGDIAATEIVDILNSVESNNLAELRTQNELNFAKFDTKLELRFAEYDTKLELRFAEYDRKLDARFAEYDRKLDVRFAAQDAKIADQFLAHTRWMLGAWTTIFLAVLGLYFRE